MHGLRTDVSFTLFLADPETYDGGELVIESVSGEDEIKLPAGHLVAYDSTSLHRVAPVTRGERMVAVGWAQSHVRDSAKRELLFDLETAKRSLFAQSGKTPEFDLLAKTSANLFRMWAEVWRSIFCNVATTRGAQSWRRSRERPSRRTIPARTLNPPTRRRRHGLLLQDGPVEVGDEVGLPGPTGSYCQE